jgi:hypothetical protein
MELKNHPKLAKVKVDIVPEAVPILEYVVGLEQVTEINAFESINPVPSLSKLSNAAIALHGSTLLVIRGKSRTQRFFIVVAGWKEVRPLTIKLKEMIEESINKQLEQENGKR